ncbi:MAG: GTP-binding protein [Candidatus Aenigmarchaeota archaeon]|nr:GTP-binding protein [Candidatus Aenigmarchaeota archaeon]
MKDYLKIVFVGHVDHGKSTLIGRLLYDTKSLKNEKYQDLKEEAKKRGGEIEFAFVMDHLKEERDKKITIDTAQTYFSTKKRNYVIIDAPGHKEFMKNMITGASQAEAAILMVDVNEGVRDQTKRHAYILNLLGIRQVLVAMNKMDLVNYEKERFEEVKEELIDFLETINIRPKYVVPISAKNGDNVAKKSDKMTWYNGPTILEALDEFEKDAAPTEKPFRFPVQDVYDFDGERIVVGRIESGKLKEGEEAIILPGRKKTRIKRIKIFNGDKKEAVAGESIGLIIDEEVERGNVIFKGEPPRERKELKVKLFWLSPEEVREGEKVIFRCTTQEVNCKIEKIEKRIDPSSMKVLEENAKRLEEHEIGEVVLSLDKPVFVDDFNRIKEMGRFVLERNGGISAGGIITEVES